jgi:transcriptional regulator of arginine metabolism
MAITTQSDARARLATLRKLLEEGTVSTQEELCEALQKKNFSVTQSTVSRDLRRIGAAKTISPSGDVVYRLPDEQMIQTPTLTTGIKGLLTSIEHNGSMIVIKTSTGSASLVAHHLDSTKPVGILGTIAGDDTIFVAPASAKQIEATMEAIVDELS